MEQFSALWGVASRSLRYRISGVTLTIASVALSVFVLLGVEHVRQEARSGFASTVSGVDLIVGARTGEVNLLLLSVFRIGNATANVSWDSVEQINAQDSVSWTVPISLGDSHRSFRVIGTTTEFFSRYQYGQKQALTLREGTQFEALQDVVLGARVASELSYELGDSIVLSHGVADTSFVHYDQLPFRVSGVLATTGTPIDNALFINLEAVDAMHADEDPESARHSDRHDAKHEVHDEHDDHDEHDEHGDHDEQGDHTGHDGRDDHDDHHAQGDHNVHDDHHAQGDHDEQGDHDSAAHDHPPIGTVTAVLVGLDSPISTLQVKRWVDDFSDEALLAILPGVALTQLWDLLGNVEVVLLGISILVFVSSLLGLNAMLLASMRERRREIEVLRSIGAPSLFILALLVIESLLIVTIGVVLAVVGLLVSIALANGLLAEELGLMMSMQIFNSSSLLALALIYLTAFVVTLIPAWQAYTVSRSVGTQPPSD